MPVRPNAALKPAPMQDLAQSALCQSGSPSHLLRAAIGASLVVNWNGPACVLMHGAKPGLVSHLVKQALLNIASDLGMKNAVPQDRKA